MQLCDGDVSVLDTMKNRRLGVEEVREKFGVPPELVGDVLALMGDSIDNVPGVAGIGPKTAAELINKFGSLDGAAGGGGRDQGEARRLHRRGARIDPPLARAGPAARRRPACRRRWRSCTGSIRIKQRLGGLFRELEFSRLAEQLAAFDKENAAKATGAGPGTAPAPVAPAPVPEPPVAVDTILDRAALAASGARDRSGGGGRDRRALRRCVGRAR